jgi:glycosyltransferase involved in cell wall biosynthesis
MIDWLRRIIYARGPFARIARLEARVDELLRLVKDDKVTSILENDVRPLLTAIARDDAGHRRALFALRETEEYELAYTDPNPLVTVAIATSGDRLDLLMSRALPSALAQTHAPLEVVVVGDAVGDAVRQAVEGLGDPRVRFFDLTQRFVHPDPQRHWLTAATLTRNEAYHRARGLWIADLDDDDALRPDAVARLLAFARAQRLEVAYGLLEQHLPSGPTARVSAFPPQRAERQGRPYQPWTGHASCGALVHAGLSLFAREHVAADIGQPGDFFRLERMVRAGVRFGMFDDVVYDYYPSAHWPR